MTDQCRDPTPPPPTPPGIKGMTDVMGLTDAALIPSPSPGSEPGVF